MTLEAEAAKGTKARLLLESEIYKEAFTKTRQAIMDTWASSPIRDAEGQHELRLMLKLLDDVNGYIVSVANTGKLAQAQIEHENKAKEMAKRVFKGLGSLISR